jgi:glycosyltransferase involved in cell wall biosynthesis
VRRPPRAGAGLVVRADAALRSRPALTLAITTFERPEYLRDCLESVRRQTDRDFRVVVLDNASSMDYTGVISEFADLDMDYVRNSSNLGGAANWLLARERYRGPEFTMIFHDDDIMHPRLLEWQRGVLERDPDVVFVTTEVLTFEDGETPPSEVFASVDDPPFEVFDGEAALARAILSGAALGFSPVMYRSSILRDVHPDPETYGIYGDRPFLLDVAQHGKSVLATAPYTLSRQHAGQDSRAGVLSLRNLVALQKRYRRALGPRLDSRDREMFYRHSKRALLGDYARFPDERRPSLVRFVAACVSARVLRLRDLSRIEWFELLRAGGFGRALDTGVAVKRALERAVSRRDDRSGG